MKAMSVEPPAPGRYETACSKGYWDCQSSEPEVLELRNPAVFFFKEESAASVYVWVPSTKQFRRIWLSD
jgi:hypothetical protein